MEQRLSLITLGVEDLERARAFYSGVLGWQSFGPAEGIVFYNLGGVVLGLWEHKNLAEDAGVPYDGPPGAYHGAALGHNLRSRADVDALLDKIRTAGGRILKPAAETFWGGYAGHFADPDNHAWEVAHNPHWPMDSEGRILTPAAT